MIHIVLRDYNSNSSTIIQIPYDLVYLTGKISRQHLTYIYHF
jgi:hypothetical protein